MNHACSKVALLSDGKVAVGVQWSPVRTGSGLGGDGEAGVMRAALIMGGSMGLRCGVGCEVKALLF